MCVGGVVGGGCWVVVGCCRWWVDEWVVCVWCGVSVCTVCVVRGVRCVCGVDVRLQVEIPHSHHPRHENAYSTLVTACLFFGFSGLCWSRMRIRHVHKRAKITRAFCRRNSESREDRIPQAAQFGDVITAGHKVLSEENESRLHHRYEVVVQDLGTQWSQSCPRRNKNAQDTMRSLQRFLPPESKLGVIYIDNSLEFTKACADLQWNHDKSTPHRSETKGIAERAVTRVRQGTSTLLFLNNGGKKRCNVIVMCETFNIYDQLEKLFSKEDTTLHSVGEFSL